MLKLLVRVNAELDVDVIDKLVDSTQNFQTLRVLACLLH